MAKCKNCKNLYRAITSDNEYVCNWCEKIKDNPYEEIERECEHYETLTNADRIRSMTDEELAEFMYDTATGNECCICGYKEGWHCKKESDKPCSDGVLKWLKSEVGCE